MMQAQSQLLKKLGKNLEGGEQAVSEIWEFHHIKSEVFADVVSSYSQILLKLLDAQKDLTVKTFHEEMHDH